MSNEFNAFESLSLFLDDYGYEVRITEEVVKSVASHSWSGWKMMNLLLEQRGEEVTITEEVVKTAVRNEIKGEEITRLLFEKRGEEITITEEVIKAAVGNEVSGGDITRLLFDKRGEEITITEEVIKAAVKNRKSGRDITRLLFDKRGEEITITEEVVKAAVGNEMSGVDITHLLFDKRGEEIHITEEVVKAAVGNEMSGVDITHLLLKQRGGEITITEGVIKAAVGNKMSGVDITHLLFDKRGEEIRITEGVIKAAVGNKMSGRDITRLLFDKRGEEIRITEEVVKAAVGNEVSGRDITRLLFDKRGEEIHITEEVVKAAVGNEVSGRDITRLLFDKRGEEIHITEEVIKTAVKNRMNGGDITHLLLKQRGGEITITEGVIKAAVGNKMSGRPLTRLLLEEHGRQVQITESLVCLIARNFDAQTMDILLKQRGEEITITEEVIKAVVENKWSGRRIIHLLLKGYGRKVQITDTLVCLIARNFDAQTMDVLLKQRGGEITITEGVIKAAVGNEMSGVDITHLLFDERGEEIHITEGVIKAAVGNEISGRPLTRLLLEEHGRQVQITESLVCLIARNFDAQTMDILLKQRGEEITITEEVIKAAVGNEVSGGDITRLLFDKRGEEITITEEVIKAAVKNRKSGRDITRLLFDKRGEEITITEEVIKAAINNRMSGGDITRLLFDERGEEITITEEVVKTAVGNEITGEEITRLLFEKRGEEITITEEVIKAAVENKTCGEDVIRLLFKQHEMESRPNEKWTRGLQTLGYSTEEIANLFYGSVYHSPWIDFVPANIEPCRVEQGLHLSDCVHFPGSSSGQGKDPNFKPLLRKIYDRDSRQSIEELCGLGGISPSSQDAIHCIGMVQFEQQNSVASISYSTTTGLENHGNFIYRLLRVAERFVTAARRVQLEHFCCDSFTILSHCGSHEAGTSSPIKLIRVDFVSALQVLEHLESLERLHRDGVDLEQGLRDLRDASRKILDQAIPNFNGVSEDGGDLKQQCLNVTSLAMQFLCVGFLSYAQAHIGRLRPFFLDTPLDRIVLHGIEPAASARIHITADLAKPTCLYEMTQGPVLTFNASKSVGDPPYAEETKAFDIRASLEDILDTWGPGQIIRRERGEPPVAIKVGGGYIIPPHSDDESGKYHWSRELVLSKVSFDLKDEVVIGSWVAINPNCSINEEACWKNMDGIGGLGELGVYNSFHETSEVQIGLQGGPDHFNITANKVWAKRRGRTIKTEILECNGPELLCALDFYWAVRISFCTGVAQRLRLGNLVADVHPSFVYSKEESSLLQVLENEHGLVENFRGSISNQPITDWLGNLPGELQNFVCQLVGRILRRFRGTGLSPDGTYFLAAWPQRSFNNRCIRVPVGGRSRWTPILADSDDCATFAYISNACLQSRDFKCRGHPEPFWNGEIFQLETAVICPEDPVHFSLQHEKAYCFHKFDDLIWVKLQKLHQDSPATLIRLNPIENLSRNMVHRLAVLEQRYKRRRMLERNYSSISDSASRFNAAMLAEA